MPGFNMGEKDWSRNLWERCKKVFQAHNTRITALEQGGGGGGSVTVTDGDPTLAWGTRSTVGTVDNTSLHVTMPAKPTYTAQDVGALPSNTTYVSGVKGDAENAYRSGQVNLTPANIGAVAKSDVIDIAHGGTGETTAAGALAALGAYANANAASNVSLFNTTTDVVSNSSVSLTPTENPRNFKMLVFNCTTSSSNSGGTRGQLLFPVLNPNDARHFALQCGSTLGYIRVQIQNNRNDIVVLTTGGFDHLYVTGIYGMFRIANN